MDNPWQIRLAGMDTSKTVAGVEGEWRTRRNTSVFKVTPCMSKGHIDG